MFSKKYVLIVRSYHIHGLELVQVDHLSYKVAIVLLQVSKIDDDKKPQHFLRITYHFYPSPLQTTLENTIKFWKLEYEIF